MRRKFLKSISISNWIKAILITGVLTTGCATDDDTDGINDNPTDEVEELITGEEPTEEEPTEEEPTEGELAQRTSPFGFSTVFL